MTHAHILKSLDIKKEEKGEEKKIVRFPLRAAGSGSERRRTPDCRAHKGKTGSRVWHVLRGFLITGRCPDDFFCWADWAGEQGEMEWLGGLDGLDGLAAGFG